MRSAPAHVRWADLVHRRVPIAIPPGRAFDKMSMAGLSHREGETVPQRAQPSGAPFPKGARNALHEGIGIATARPRPEGGTGVAVRLRLRLPGHPPNAALRQCNSPSRTDPTKCTHASGPT